MALAQSKAGRLAADCSKAEVRAPCSPTRRWKCVLINGRWRRHKCRNETEPQPKMSTKKCACFTPSGLVYTRLETDGTIARRPVELPKENNTRSRRSISNDVYEPNTVDSILEENPSIGHLSFNSEPVNEVENREAKTKIDKLIEETEAFLEAYEKTKENIDHRRIKRRAQHWNNHNNKHKHKNDAIVNSNESSLECKVEKSGRVNCSQVIYNDLKAWHTNRLSLEDQIRDLRTKLEDLKEIKRHLKTTKPVVETQTVNPALITNQLFNKTILRDHNITKEHLRKRIHRVKPKHRNSTIVDKRIRQFNEYAIPTVNAKTKEDDFDMQVKNVTRTDAEPNITNEVVNVTFDAELPKPQVTTIVIENNYLDHTNVADKSTILSVISTTDDLTTELSKQSSSTRKPESITEEPTTEDFLKNVEVYAAAIDKLITTEKSTPILSTEEPTTIKPHQTTVKQTSSHPTLLGPARLDASEYEQRNPNKGVAKDLGIFDKPVDVFQRRLHPLYIQNEDKHVCYCEEGRRTKGVGHSIFEAAQRVREEQRKRKALLLRKKLRKAKKRAELEKLCESERMNCYRHDNEHWRTAPFWTAGPFCFCMSTSNNTYNCVRTINATHNILYCEFITGLVTYYNLRIDPFETQNRYKYLTPEEKSYFHNQLQQLLGCRGPSCRRFSHSNPDANHEDTLNRRFENEHMIRGEYNGYERPWRWNSYGRRYARARELHRRRHMMSF